MLPIRVTERRVTDGRWGDKGTRVKDLHSSDRVCQTDKSSETEGLFSTSVDWEGCRSHHSVHPTPTVFGPDIT